MLKHLLYIVHACTMRAMHHVVYCICECSKLDKEIIAEYLTILKVSKCYHINNKEI